MEKIGDQYEKTFLNASAGVLSALARLFGQVGGVERAALFGSRARGDFSERSDYDVAVFGNLSAAEILHLRSACREELSTLHKIDLIFVNEVSDEKFLQSIQTEGIVFYDKVAK